MFYLIFSLFILIITLFTSVQIYLSLKGVKRIYRIIAVSLNILSAVVLLVRFVGDKFIPQNLLSYFSDIGYGWFFITCYTIIFFILYNAVMLTDKIFNFLPPQHKLQTAKVRFIGFVSLCGLLVTLLIIGHYNFTNIDIVYLQKSTTKELSGDFRAVFISDVHLGDHIDGDDMNNYIDKINALNPNVVIIGGDLFDNRIKPLREQKIEQILSRFKTKQGVYFILGNHEHYGQNINLINKIAADANITILKDSCVVINNEVLILGRDDRYNINRLDIDNIIDNTIDNDSLKNSCFTIAVDHQPTDLDDAVEAKFDYILAGHTHKGQFWPGSYIVDKVHKYAYGYYQPNSTSSIYVSSGLGIWGPKYRINSHSEIVVLDVKSVNSVV